MSNKGPSDPYPHAAARAAYNMAVAIVDKPTVAQIELIGTMFPFTLMGGWTIHKCGVGILTATDKEGRVFKIEITQVDGPK